MRFDGGLVMGYSPGNLVYLFGSIVSGALLSIVQTVISKDRIKSLSDNLIYQLFIYVTCAVIMGLFGAKGGTFSTYTIILGCISGLLIVAEVACTLEAFRCGSMSLTNMFVMAAMIVPIILSGVLWGERSTLPQIIGTVLTLCSMALILNLYTEFRNRNAGGAQISFGISKRWIVFSFCAFFSAGLQGVVQKYLTVSDSSSELMQFLFVGFLTASVFTALLLAGFIIRKKEKVTMKSSPLLVLAMILSGVLMSALHLTFMRSLECLPITLALAGSGGARLILLTVVDMFLFHQSITKEQLVGILVGLAAIICISL